MNRVVKLITKYVVTSVTLYLVRAFWNALQERSRSDSPRVQGVRNRLARRRAAWDAAPQGQAAVAAEQAELAAAADEAAAAAHLQAAETLGQHTTRQATEATAAELRRARRDARRAARDSALRLKLAAAVAGENVGELARDSAQVATERLAAALTAAERELQSWQQEIAKSPQFKTARKQALHTWAQYGWGEAKVRRIARRRRADRLSALAIGAGLGAVALYFLDPQAGRQRREQVRERAGELLAGFRERLSGPGEQFGLGSNRSIGDDRMLRAPGWDASAGGVRIDTAARPTGEEFVVSELRGDAGGSQALRTAGEPLAPASSSEAGAHHVVPDLPQTSAEPPAAAVLRGAAEGQPVADSAAQSETAVERAVDQIDEAAANPPADGDGAGASVIPLGQWQQMFDEMIPEGETRDARTETGRGGRGKAAPVSEARPLLGASVNLRADGRDVRLLFGRNLGTHVEHLVENVQTLEVLREGRGYAGFRLHAAEGVTTVRFER